MMMTNLLIVFVALLPSCLCLSHDHDCDDMVCDSPLECRIVKPCDQLDQCPLVALCVAKETFRKEGCKTGLPLLFESDAILNLLTCNKQAPCPIKTHCSTALKDVAAVCCHSDHANTTMTTGTAESGTANVGSNIGQILIFQFMLYFTSLLF